MVARLALVALIAAASPACIKEIDRAPGTGGTGGTGGNQPGDGADAGADGAAPDQISGVLCRLTDLRFFEVCTRTDLSAIDIGIRGSSATALTDSDGNFVIDRPASGPVILEIGFASQTVKSSIFEISLASNQVTVPMVLQADYDNLLDALLVFEPDGTGSMAIYARDGAAAVPGVEVVPPSGSQPPFYDAGSALEWSQLGLTGVGGAALIFAVGDEDRVALSLVDAQSVAVDLIPPIEEAALTFAVGRF